MQLAFSWVMSDRLKDADGQAITAANPANSTTRPLTWASIRAVKPVSGLPASIDAQATAGWRDALLPSRPHQTAAFSSALPTVAFGSRPTAVVTGPL